MLLIFRFKWSLVCCEKLFLCLISVLCLFVCGFRQVSVKFMCRLHYQCTLGFQFAEIVETEIVEIRHGKGFETESPACGKTQQEEH